MTACTTPAVEGISVTTRSERLFRMRREIIKLLLVSHPLDCPQCDKGGECRLQDLVDEHGIETADYTAFREDRKEPYATPLIRYWQLRCVLCGTVLPRLPRNIGPGRNRPRREGFCGPDHAERRRRLHLLRGMPLALPGGRPDGEPEPREEPSLADRTDRNRLPALRVRLPAGPGRV